MIQEDYDKKIAKLSQIEGFCAIPPVVLLVLPHRAADPDRALLSLLFRIAVAVLSFFAIVLLEVWKFLLRREAKVRATAPPASDDVRYPRA